MAPEILFGAPYGRRADIWALGGTILEIASGQHPWSKENGTDNLKMELEDLKRNMLAEKLPEIPGTLTPGATDFIKLCLKHNKSQRPFAKDLLNHEFITKYTKWTQFFYLLIHSIFIIFNSIHSYE